MFKHHIRIPVTGQSTDDRTQNQSDNSLINNVSKAAQQYNTMRYDTMRCDAMRCNAMQCREGGEGGREGEGGKEGGERS